MVKVSESPRGAQLRIGTRPKASQRGMALVLALVILALGLAVGAAIAGNLIRGTLLMRRQAEAVEMAALLDAGMAQTLAELSQSRTWPGDSLKLPVGQVDMRTTLLGLERVGVELEATYRGRTRRVDADVLIRPGAAPMVTSWRLMTPALTNTDPLTSP